MADRQTSSYDYTISRNVLVLDSTASEKTTLVQEMACNPMFGNLESVHWISKVWLSKQREVEIDFCFPPEVDFLNPQDKYDLRKSFNDLENLYRAKIEKKGIVANTGNGMGEHIERHTFIVLDDVRRFADRSPSFVTFMTTCRTFGYTLCYVFHKTAISSPKWKDTLSQTQIFCIFPSAMDLVINYLVKFVSRSDAKGYVSRQQLWLTNLVRVISKKSGFSSFCVVRRPHVFSAAKYRLGVENFDQQECFLNLNTFDKLFNTFTSRRTDNREVIEFVIEKQIGKAGSGKIYELKTNKNGE